MTPELETLETLLTQLHRDADAISFYEAVAVVRDIALADDLPGSLMHELVCVVRAPQTTDGAKAILGDFLSSYHKRVETQRLLAARPITLRDSGKTARGAVGDVLTVRLEERRSSGYAWNLAASRGGADTQRVSGDTSDASLMLAIFAVTLLQPGRAHLAFSEDLLSPPIASPSRRQTHAPAPRCFSIDVVIENSTQ